MLGNISELILNLYKLSTPDGGSKTISAVNDDVLMKAQYIVRKLKFTKEGWACLPTEKPKAVDFTKPTHSFPRSSVGMTNMRQCHQHKGAILA